jgi:hypothetical protein
VCHLPGSKHAGEILLRFFLNVNVNILKILLKGIDKSVISYYHAQMMMPNKTGNPRYMKGQKVIIKPVSEKGVTQREYNVYEYAGRVGEITNFYSISPRTGQIFFIYNVRVGKDRKEIVVYEDELEPNLS